MAEITLEDIEKGLGQIKTNMATKDEVVKLIDEKVAEDNEKIKAENQKAFDEAKTTVDELKKANDSMVAQIKLLKSTGFSAIKTPAGNYNGMWGNIETAKNFGLFVLSEIAGCKAASDRLDGLGIERKRILGKDLGEGSNALGGILVPTEFIPHLIMLLEKYGVFRRNTLEWPMSSDSALAPKLSSGLTVYCPGAGAAPTKSDPGFSSVGMQAKKWMTLTAIDSELTEDSAIAIGEIVGYLIAHAFSKKEDEVGFLGDGTSTYFGHTGIVGALMAVDATIANIKSLVVGAGNGYSELTLANFESLLGTVHSDADDGDLKWFVHRYFYFTVMIPVEFTSVMPKAEANSQICALFANLKKGTYLGDRRKLTIDKSSERYFEEDQIGIRGTERVAPTVYGEGDTTDAGPICGLITAAS